MKKVYDIFIGLLAFFLALFILVIGKVAVSDSGMNGIGLLLSYVLLYSFVAALLAFSWKSITAKTEPNNRENEDDTSLDDEILYEYVLLNEIEEDNKVKSTWAKALAHSDGIDVKAESIYMQYRVQSIKDQFDAQKIAYDEMSKESLFDYIKNGFKDPIAEQRKLEEERKIEEEKKLEELQEQEILELDKEENKTLAFTLLIILGIFIVITAFN
ncbi:hypothetical protein ACLHDG_07800 [Sulfurovum sp. CS9]|uniref:hypothetical protein n=1 Tax=Sulfurovum sp. CS9 TaxID=3391146 RepID=UPI0039E9EBD2